MKHIDSAQNILLDAPIDISASSPEKTVTIQTQELLDQEQTINVGVDPVVADNQSQLTAKDSAPRKVVNESLKEKQELDIMETIEDELKNQTIETAPKDFDTIEK